MTDELHEQPSNAVDNTEAECKPCAVVRRHRSANTNKTRTDGRFASIQSVDRASANVSAVDVSLERLSRRTAGDRRGTNDVR